ncbi:ATP-binding protein [Paucibacter sp. R3-3]|uniref:histidine kinase n=1 Tax=Roseateles agri TaxID=3098619 RepID=A0ABU5DJQ9_9BURK|nr:ATP-binding protein [Paucibacter sp. R3-3]MDY0746533.1 ATP-binding protein [Paucibacter sp. R3-3]
MNELLSWQSWPVPHPAWWLLAIGWLVLVVLLAYQWARHRRLLARHDAQQESQARFQKIYETTPDAVGITSVATRRYIDVNPGYHRLFGFHREEVLGKTVLDLGIWPSDAERARFWEEFNRTGKVDSMEAHGRHRDGHEVVVLVSVRLLIESGEPYHLFIVRDITDWRRLQREADSARAQVAAAAAASEAKTEFLSRMSHELRTPLNAVLGFAQLLRDTPAIDAAEAERARVDAILKAGWHLLTLIDDVLDIARIESGHIHTELQPLRLRALLDEATALLRPQAEQAGIELTVDDAAGDCMVQGDPLRLRQSLINLLSNAVKYNQPGGRVSVSGTAEAGRYVLRIADTGCGMSELQMAHLFEPFNRLGRELGSVQGTGIGLVLTRKLLELMGAGLQLESRPGEGTTARVELLLAGPLAAGATAGRISPRAADTLPPARVLYIEDNLVNQQIVQAALRPWAQLELHLAEDGETGLRLAAELQPDLLLLDMRLPDIDGIEVLARLRRDPALAQINVVALSASAMPGEIELAKAAGAIEYWTKPIRLDRFVADLRRVLG